MGALNLLPEWTALLWSFLTTLKKWIECLKVKLWFRVPSPPCCLCLIPQRKSSFLTSRVCRWIRAAVFPSWGSGNKGDEASQGGTLFPRPETVSWPSQTVHEEQRNFRAADFHWSGGFLKAKETVAESQTTNYRWWIRLFCFLFQLGCSLVSLFCLEECFISNICDKMLGSFNLNGARDDVKRASLFSLINAKRLNVIFLQETHSTADNEAEWKREWRGEFF